MVVTTAPYLEDPSADDGISIRSPSILLLTEIKKDSWADKNSDFGNYIGWSILKVNDVAVTNLDEINALVKAGDFVTYTMGPSNAHSEV